MKDTEKKKLISKRTFSNMLVVAFGIGLYMFLANYQFCMLKIKGFFSIVSPFTWAFVLAFLLNMPMTWLEKKVFQKRKFKRVYAVICTYIIAFVIISSLLVLVLPDVVVSMVNLIENMPAYINEIGNMVTEISQRFHLEPESAQAILGTWEEFVNVLFSMVPQILDATMALGNGLMNALMAIIISIYMLMSKDTLARQAKKGLYAMLDKEKADNVVEFANRSQRVFVGFINGKILDSAIIGFICYCFMYIFGFEYYSLISVIVGITNVIPFFGPFIGAIPSIVILITVDPWQALWFAVWILALQQFDGNILGPRILGNSTGLSPMWVLLAIVIGGGMFGFTGMLIGVPTFAVIYSVISNYFEKKLDEKGIDMYGRAKKEDAQEVDE